MSAGEVLCTTVGPIATLTFNRPESFNAMTWHMYDQLEAHCARLGAGDPAVRAIVLRGSGGRAFVSGTDISQFSNFETGADGVEYERRIDRVIAAVQSLRCPAVAVVQGWCTGGGLAIAAACDFRIVTPDAKFGMPVARTLGNCLSAANAARLVASVGLPWAKRMLMSAEMMDAPTAAAQGFVTRLATAETLEQEVDAFCANLSGLAPLTLWAAKETMRRLQDGVPPDEDVVAACYGSADFHEGVDSFLNKRKPLWTGR